MNGKRHTPEQIIQKLRQAEVEISKGSTVPQAAKKIGVTEQTFYRFSGGCDSLLRSGRICCEA